MQKCLFGVSHFSITQGMRSWKKCRVSVFWDTSLSTWIKRLVDFFFCIEIDSPHGMCVFELHEQIRGKVAFSREKSGGKFFKKHTYVTWFFWIHGPLGSSSQCRTHEDRKHFIYSDFRYFLCKPWWGRGEILPKKPFEFLLLDALDFASSIRFIWC